ncbi:MAG: hypothetical protein AVDCRST_MAG02-1231, partial [uncultured Rubrobacteraceae bacterium]
EHECQAGRDGRDPSAGRAGAVLEDAPGTPLTGRREAAVGRRQAAHPGLEAGGGGPDGQRQRLLVHLAGAGARRRALRRGPRGHRRGVEALRPGDAPPLRARRETAAAGRPGPARHGESHPAAGAGRPGQQPGLRHHGARGPRLLERGGGRDVLALLPDAAAARAQRRLAPVRRPRAARALRGLGTHGADRAGSPARRPRRKPRRPQVRGVGGRPEARKRGVPGVVAPPRRRGRVGREKEARPRGGGAPGPGAHHAPFSGRPRPEGTRARSLDRGGPGAAQGVDGEGERIDTKGHKRV